MAMVIIEVRCQAVRKDHGCCCSASLDHVVPQDACLSPRNYSVVVAAEWTTDVGCLRVLSLSPQKLSIVLTAELVANIVVGIPQVAVQSVQLC